MLPGREFAIGSLGRVLSRRRWLLIAPLFLGILGGLLYSRSQPSLYRSDAIVQVVPQRVPESYVSPTVTDRVEDRLRSLSHQVLSRTQLEKLVTEFNLFPDERQRLPLEDVLQTMTARVIIAPMTVSDATRRDSQSEAFRVSFDYENAVLAQKVVERLASFFVDTNARDRGSQADQTSQFLDAQLADARGRLEAQDQKLKTFRERNSGRLPTQVQANMQAIQNTQMALQALVESLARDRDRRLVLERLYTDAQAEDDAVRARAAATPVLSGGDALSKLPPDATPAQRLEAARSVLAQMELRLSPKHPDVVRTKRFITDLVRQVESADLERPLSMEPGSVPADTPEESRRRDKLRDWRAEIESLDRQIVFKEGEEKRLRAEIGIYQARLEAVPGTESEWVALTRDYDTQQAAYNDLLIKSENSKLAASLEQRQIGEQFRILDPPRVPLKPRSPDRIRINAMATAAGLGLGLLLLGLAEHRDTTMRSEADVAGAIKLPVLVVLPFVTTRADVRRDRGRRLTVSAGVVVVCLATAGLFWYLELWKYIA